MNELRNVTLTDREWHYLKKLVRETMEGLEECQNTIWYDMEEHGLLDRINTELEKQLNNNDSL